MNRHSLVRILGLALPAALCVSFVCSAPVIAKPRRKHSASNNSPVANTPNTPTPPGLSDAPEPVPVPPSQPAAPAPVAAPALAPTTPPPIKSNVELDALVAEYGAIRDELFRSRAKAAVLSEALFKTKIEVTFRYEASRAWPLKKLSLRLDERPVYSGESLNGDQAQKIFETVAAPGRHVLTARVEASGVGEDRVSYVTEDSFGFEIADDKLTRVELTVDENGSGAGPFAAKKSGSFDLHVKANVKSLAVEKK